MRRRAGGLPASLRSLSRDERGGVAILAAAVFAVIMGFAAFAIDLGSVFVDRRRAQSTADLAAIAAAADLSRSTQAAEATLRRNNLPPDARISIELGIYKADPQTPAAQRFTPSSAPGANAARVKLNTVSPLFFGRALTGRNTFEIGTQAIAAQSAFASFAIGSRLAAINGGLLNAMLGALLGGNLSLSVMDYQALADARLDLFDYANTLAAGTHVTAGTYDSLIDTKVNAYTAAKALADTARAATGASSAAARALDAIAETLRGTNTKILMRALIDLGPYGTMSVGSKPRAGVTVSALDIVTAFAQLANAQHQVETNVSLGIAGIASVSLQLAVGERPQGTSWVTVGAQNASVHTAQTRLLLTIQLLGGGILPGLSLPIYIELASATARLSELRCGQPTLESSSLKLEVTPAVIDAWIGGVSDSQFTDFQHAPNPPAAKLIDILLLKVSGRAHATITNLNPSTMSFSYADVQAQTKKTAGTTDLTSSLVTKLLDDLQLSISASILSFGTPGIVGAAVNGLLRDRLLGIDQVLSSALNVLGVGIGQADVWATGLRCDGAVLVN